MSEPEYERQGRQLDVQRASDENSKWRRDAMDKALSSLLKDNDK